MKLTLKQTKLVGLTMELDLKVREYQELCAKLEELERENVDANSPKLTILQHKFLNNAQEIKRIKNELKKLEEK